MSLELKSGVSVVFIDGKYKNQNLRGEVDRLTPKKVWVIIGNGAYRNQRVCVNQTSVAAVAETENRESVSQAREDTSKSRPTASHPSQDGLVSNRRVEPRRLDATRSSRPPRTVSLSPQNRSAVSQEEYVFVDASDGQSLVSTQTADDVFFVDAESTFAGDHSASTFIDNGDNFVDALTSSDEELADSYVDVQSQAETISGDTAGDAQIDTTTSPRQFEADAEMPIVSDDDEPFEDAMDDMDETMTTAPVLPTRVQTRSMTWRHDDEPFEDAMDDMDETMTTAPVLPTRVRTRSMTWRHDDEPFEDAMDDMDETMTTAPVLPTRVRTRSMTWRHDDEPFEEAMDDIDETTVTAPVLPTRVRTRSMTLWHDDEPFEDAMDDMDETTVTAPVLPTRVQTRSMTWRQDHPAVFSPLSVANMNIDFLRLLLPGQKTHKHRTFGYHFFGDRLLTFEFKTASISSNMTLPISFGWQGRQYEILSSKLHREKIHKLSGPSMRITVQYVAVTDTHILEHELNMIADFGALPPHKAASRLELFESPAAMDNRKDRHCLLFDDLTTSDIEYFQGDSECGYVPEGTITNFLGTHAIGKRTDALQVRLLAPKLGVFKGMLVEKPGIHKIQLPSGTRKVGPSSVAGEDDDWACLVITMRHPSDRNVKMEQLLRAINSNTSIKLPEWFIKDTKKPLSDMLTRLLENLGVPREVWKQYYIDYADDKSRTKLQHTFVVGVADPTGCLPEGHIFVTGLLKNGVCQEELFVTRFPCMERKDGRLLPVITSKPFRMTDQQWTDLMSRDVGTIIFANSGPGKRPLPELIANGDLDGDLYFVCWNETILSNLRHAEPVDLKQPAGLAAVEREPTGRFSMTAPKPGWLRQTQHHVADLRTIMDHSKLFAKLHSLSIKEADMTNEGMNDPDVVQYGRAYKQALDIGKHGGKVTLPRRLWDQIPETLHKYLEDREQ
jgi:hypothetical protein